MFNTVSCQHKDDLFSYEWRERNANYKIYVHVFVEETLLGIHQSMFFLCWVHRKMKFPHPLWSDWGHVIEFWPTEPMSDTSRPQTPLLHPPYTLFPLDGN